MQIKIYDYTPEAYTYMYIITDELWMFSCQHTITVHQQPSNEC